MPELVGGLVMFIPYVILVIPFIWLNKPRISSGFQIDESRIDLSDSLVNFGLTSTGIIDLVIL